MATTYKSRDHRISFPPSLSPFLPPYHPSSLPPSYPPFLLAPSLSITHSVLHIRNDTEQPGHLGRIQGTRLCMWSVIRRYVRTVLYCTVLYCTVLYCLSTCCLIIITPLLYCIHLVSQSTQKHCSYEPKYYSVPYYTLWKTIQHYCILYDTV